MKLVINGADVEFDGRDAEEIVRRVPGVTPRAPLIPQIAHPECIAC
jgi:hypothetical protein